ncbi:MAG: orotate phosphoribosyltransferase [Brevinematales bacterium]|nr:orotate phosphoribosyltransferase [Brevinematales bacterium]
MDKEKFIDFLIDSRVLLFGDFTTKSGRKTPYFINTGIFDDGRKLSILADYYADIVHEKFPGATLLFGPAYKGIPLSIITSVKLYEKYRKVIGVSYNRKEVKDHGEGGMIIGRKPTPDDKVVIIEDVITSGISIRESIDILKTNGNPIIIGAVVSVDRMEKGKTKLATQEIKDEFGIDIIPIVNIIDILDYLKSKKGNNIPGEIVKAIETYLGIH